MVIFTCPVCGFRLESGLVGAWPHWQVVVNQNQNYLGKLMLVLRRHEEDVTALTPEEQTEFWRVLQLAREALVRLFQPEHFNYAFLMNQDAHVHLHVIPRYAQPRQFAGLEFADGGMGEHYQLTQKIVPPQMGDQLAAALREQLERLE